MVIELDIGGREPQSSQPPGDFLRWEGAELLDLAGIPLVSPALGPPYAADEAYVILGPRDGAENLETWDLRASVLEDIYGPPSTAQPIDTRLRAPWDASQPLLDRIPRELLELAGIQWVDWTPLPPLRIQLIWERSGRVSTAEAEADRRFAVMSWLATDFARHELASVGFDELAGDQESAERVRQLWAQGIRDHPDLGRLLRIDRND